MDDLLYACTGGEGSQSSRSSAFYYITFLILDVIFFPLYVQAHSSLGWRRHLLS